MEMRKRSKVPPSWKDSSASRSSVRLSNIRYENVFTVLLTSRMYLMLHIRFILSHDWPFPLKIFPFPRMIQLTLFQTRSKSRHSRKQLHSIIDPLRRIRNSHLIIRHIPTSLPKEMNRISQLQRNSPILLITRIVEAMSQNRSNLPTALDPIPEMPRLYRMRHTVFRHFPFCPCVRGLEFTEPVFDVPFSFDHAWEMQYHVSALEVIEIGIDPLLWDKCCVWTEVGFVY